MWVPGVLRATPEFSGGFREWIIQRGWAPSIKLTQKKATFDVHEQASLVDSLVNDFIALSAAAFESSVSVEVRADEPKGCAWQVISYYYSAYFAANAIMRLAGFIFTNVEVDTCAEINERALLYGLGGTDEKSKFVPSVVYGVVSLSKSTTLSLHSLSGVKGGVHIQFWAGFLRFLDNLDSNIGGTPLPSDDKKMARAELKLLREALTRSSRQNGSWLSEVRNAVNYRFEGGVWYPYQSSEIDGPSLRQQLRSGVNGAPMIAASTSAPDCKRLVSVSGYLLRWAKSSLELIDKSARHGKRKRIREGALTFSEAV